MGLWHGVEHWEMNKINVDSQTELFVKAWPDVSQFCTRFLGKIEKYEKRNRINTENLYPVKGTGSRAEYYFNFKINAHKFRAVLSNCAKMVKFLSCLVNENNYYSSACFFENN